MRAAPAWKQHLTMAGVCLALTVAAIAAGWLSPSLSVVLLAGAFAAGLRYTAIEAARNTARGRVDIDLLMLMVALGAWFLGHPEEGAFLLVLFSASRAMEEYARARTHRSIEDLSRGLPQSVTVVEEGEYRDSPVDELQEGVCFLIRPGERVPLDCVVVDGESDVDLSAMTGESRPMVAAPGLELPSGAINGRGLIRARALRPASESAWQKVIQLIESAPARRSPAEVLSDRIGRYVSVGILGAAATGFLAWWLIVGLSAEAAGYRAMVLLVAGSPCAIVLSIPSAILAAIARGAHRGILFNGGIGLYSLGQARTVAFDKTGTLTSGEPDVIEIAGPAAEDRGLLEVALSLARSSTHPASRSIERFLKERGIDPGRPVLDDVEELPGRGVRGQWRGVAVELGRGQPGEGAKQAAVSQSVFSVGGEPRIHFHLSESAREDAAETVSGLAARGMRSIVLSGDAQPAVDRLAGEVGIEEARGGLTPEEKWSFVSQAAQDGGIIMVGDGVNDAPALCAATTGVAMGVRGSAATLAQADIILAQDRLSKLLEAWDLGRATRRVIRQNLTISIGAASLMIVAAAMGNLPLILGVLGHEGGTVLVVLNSLRLLLRQTAETSPWPKDSPDVHVGPAGVTVNTPAG